MPPNNAPQYFLTDGPEITLAQMLEARDLRVQRQENWLSLYHLPLISLTMVIPGVVKDSSASRFLFKEAVDFSTLFLQENNFSITAREIFDSDCGSEALFAINADALDIKQICIQIENEHFLGRLWDFDVICPKNGGLSRSDQGELGRRCLVCDDQAHLCTRSQKHSKEELLSIIELRINTFAKQNQ